MLSSGLGSKMSDVVSFTFTWHALSDACDKCQRLNGKEYPERDIFENTLWDPVWGDIWNFDADHTLAHPNCRCQLEVRVKPSETLEEDLEMLKVELLLLRDEIKGSLERLRGR